LPEGVILSLPKTRPAPVPIEVSSPAIAKHSLIPKRLRDKKGGKEGPAFYSSKVYKILTTKMVQEFGKE